jgi:hypothetical protein
MNGGLDPDDNGGGHVPRNDADWIADAAYELARRIGRVRAERGRDFIRGLPWGKLYDEFDRKMHSRKGD